MGFLDFLKKKQTVSAGVPLPPSPPGNSIVSRFDDPLKPLQPLAPPSPPSFSSSPSSSPSLPSSSVPSLPFPPKPALPSQPIIAPKPVSFPPLSVPLPTPPPVTSPRSPPSPLAENVVPSTPLPLSVPSKPFAAPPPSTPEARTHAPREESSEALKLTNSSVPKPIPLQSHKTLPQVTPPIRGTQTTPSPPPSFKGTSETTAETKPTTSSPSPSHSPSSAMAIPAGEAAVPTTEELRRVLEELQRAQAGTSVSVAAATSPMSPSSPVRPAPQSAVPKRLQYAFIPVSRFEQSLRVISSASSTVAQTQLINEKFGAIETQTKTSVEALARSFENIHSALLALDEKLFQVK